MYIQKINGDALSDFVHKQLYPDTKVASKFVKTEKLKSNTNLYKSGVYYCVDYKYPNLHHEGPYYFADFCVMHYANRPISNEDFAKFMVENLDTKEDKENYIKDYKMFWATNCKTNYNNEIKKLEAVVIELIEVSNKFEEEAQK